MRIGEVVSKPIPLDGYEGVCVRTLTETEVEGIRTKVRAWDQEDTWGLLRYKAASMLCDADGNDLEGVSTVDELKGQIAEGTLRDMCVEAEDVLTVGKRIMRRLLRSG